MPADRPDVLPVADAVNAVRRALPEAAPKLGIVLGSGLGAVTQAIHDPITFPYRFLPGFPEPSVEGHGGDLLLGRIGDWPVAVLQGRVHLYEGQTAQTINVMTRTLRGLGCEALLLTNAAGSLRPEVGPGSVCLIEDHINHLGANPLIGANDDRIGPRFVDMSAAYDPHLRELLRRAATALHLDLPGGVYLATTGPSFETPAEIRAYRTLGADLVGMSTVLECISARHCGLAVAGLSIVTNFAAGMAGSALSHDETLREAGQAARKVAQLIERFCHELAHGAANDDT